MVQMWSQAKTLTVLLKAAVRKITRPKMNLKQGRFHGSKRKKNSQPRSSVKAATKKKRTTRTKPDTGLKNDELEELTSWIFLTEQAASSRS